MAKPFYHEPGFKSFLFSNCVALQGTDPFTVYSLSTCWQWAQCPSVIFLEGLHFLVLGCLIFVIPLASHVSRCLIFVIALTFHTSGCLIFASPLAFQVRCFIFVSPLDSHVLGCLIFVGHSHWGTLFSWVPLPLMLGYFILVRPLASHVGLLYFCKSLRLSR